MAMQLFDGMALGLALIMPIGAQNLFIIQQGITVGYPRVFYATLSTTACDALMITAGALGLATVVQGHGPLRTTLIVLGGVFLLYLAWQNLQTAEAEAAAEGTAPRRTRGIISGAVGVSLLNPHAILDTVGVIGAVAVTRGGMDRAWFASGAVLASLLWFSLLGTIAFALSDRLTTAWRRGIALASSLVMAAFALMLWSEVVLG
jgi:L-lysine exporter family protein LysE/ArgO